MAGTSNGESTVAVMSYLRLAALVVFSLLATGRATAEPRVGAAIGVMFGVDSTNPYTRDLLALGPSLEGTLAADPLRLRLRLAGGRVDGAETEGNFVQAGVGIDVRKCARRACGGIGAELGEARYSYTVTYEFYPVFLATTAALSIFGELGDPRGVVFGVRVALRGKRIHGETDDRYQRGVFADVYVGVSF